MKQKSCQGLKFDNLEIYFLPFKNTPGLFGAPCVTRLFPAHRSQDKSKNWMEQEAAKAVQLAKDGAAKCGFNFCFSSANASGQRFFGFFWVGCSKQMVICIGNQPLPKKETNLDDNIMTGYISIRFTHDPA